MKPAGNRVRFRSGCAALVATAVMVLAACSSSSSPSAGTVPGSTGPSSTPSASAGKAPATVSFTETIPTAPFAFLYAAEGSTGAFAAVEKQFNTKIEFTKIANPADAAGAMISGSVTVSFAGLQNYLIAQAAGKDVVAAFTGAVGAPGVLIAPKKYEASRGTDLAKFAGGTFGYTKEGSGSQFNTKFAAEKAGLDWTKVKHVAFGSPSAALPLLQTGRLDVAAVDPTTAIQAINAGAAYLLLNFSDAKAAGQLALQLGTVWAFNKSFTTQYPELTKALVQAMLTGLNAVKKAADDPAAVLALFPTATQTALSKGWTDAWALSKAAIVASDGTLPADAVTATVDFQKSNGILTAAQAATASTVIDNDFVG